MEDKSGEAPTSSRWNPTKEQISVLEGLYKQGMRTPSAEQIQQITRRLEVYGHIEGKNVFYWFQNHKARQRQKQKQECMVYINQFLHKPTHAPVFSPTSPPCSTNVVCSPFCVPQRSAIGFYPHQHAKVALPSSVGRRAIIATDNSKTAGAVSFAPSYNEGNIKKYNNNCHETLALFPLHPTGILEHGRSSSPGKSFSSSSVASNNHSISAETGVSSDHDHQDGFSSSTKPSNFIDFFTEHTA